jgi:hypothetical protein
MFVTGFNAIQNLALKSLLHTLYTVQQLENLKSF